MTGTHRERLKLLDFEFERLPSGRCRCRVVLEWQPGDQYEGTAESLGSQAAELRCCAQAGVNALQAAVGTRMTFELLGVKAVKAFDATVVIVSLSCKNGNAPSRVVGSCLAPEDPHRGAVLAVLNATNRLLGNIVDMR
jgi:hypothetical protein